MASNDAVQVLYGTGEASRRLGISPQWLKELEARGDIRAAARVPMAQGDASLYLASAIEKLQRERRLKAKKARRGRMNGNGNSRVNGNGHHGG